MADRLKIAVAGLGRMGPIHALHVRELALETGQCELAAVADLDPERARRLLVDLGVSAPVFRSIEELARAGVAQASIVVTPTDQHREHAAALIEARQRVLLEKPLTGTLEGDRAFASELDRRYPDALMLAFQRRFDEPLRYAKQLLDTGVIGRVFKVYSALEGSRPMPEHYRSGGILPDMSVHNIDEILWLTGRMPYAALAVGSRLYSYRLVNSPEDFDDALLYLWFDNEMAAQVQVSRNHVSGYRVETTLFGEQGQIHIGHFDQKPLEITVEAYGPRGRAEPLAYRAFRQRDYRRPLPEFVDRFGAAYKAELAAFIECCRTNAPFPVTHRDGVRAQEVVSAGMRAVVGLKQAAKVGSE